MSKLQGREIPIVDDDRFIRGTIRLVPRAIGRCIIAEADDGAIALAEAAACASLSALRTERVRR